MDGAGNVFIVDSGNCIIRKVSASTRIVSTVAGTPPDSLGNYYCGYAGRWRAGHRVPRYIPLTFYPPQAGVALNSSGNIFIADTGNGVIGEVSGSTGIITTVAGVANSLDHGTGDGGPATSATFFAPYGVTVDNFGNIFVADNYDYAVREVMAVNGNIYTIAGNIGSRPGFFG